MLLGGAGHTSIFFQKGVEYNTGKHLFFRIINYSKITDNKGWPLYLILRLEKLSLLHGICYLVSYGIQYHYGNFSDVIT